MPFRLKLESKLRTYNLASTQFYHQPCFYPKTEFLLYHPLSLLEMGHFHILKCEGMIFPVPREKMID